MLTALELENFKGIASRQRVDFAPLTLLFSANSAGKSSILQALLYLHEVLERGGADVDRTELGGSVLELGGFARLVHRHETGRSIVLRAEFTAPMSLERLGRDMQDFAFPDLDDQLEGAWLELKVAFRNNAAFRGPLVEKVVVGCAGDPDPLVQLRLGDSLREGEPLKVDVNLGHRLLLGDVASEWSDLAIPGEAAFADWVDFDTDRPLLVFAVSRSRLSALPPMDEPLRIVTTGEVESLRAQASALLQRVPASVLEGESHQRQVAALQEQLLALERTESQIRLFLEMVVLGTASQLLTTLRETVYIGPLRTIPPRGFLYERAGRAASWADGLAAWDLLLSDRGDLVERTNKWLKDLEVGCHVVVQQLFDRASAAEDVTDGHVDKTVRRLLLDTGGGSLVLPAEVGAGISQLIPVVVAALARGAGLSLVEQPEIHVHPAVQVGLGDLFVDAVAGGSARRTMIVETHSEHLLLRVMRRMRETSEDHVRDEHRPVHPADVMVLFVERSDGRTIVRQMPLNERCELVKAWPGGFFEEGLREVF